MKQKKEYRTSVILSEEHHQLLSAYAEKHDVSTAWVVRQALVQFLKQSDLPRSKSLQNKQGNA
ncbi:MAG: hypothetical protein INF44_00380 [Thalassospira sp.]|jgi:hypothetical protein|nr:hypothetical protein [Thalassospira sp.]